MLSLKSCLNLIGINFSEWDKLVPNDLDALVLERVGPVIGDYTRDHQRVISIFESKKGEKHGTITYFMTMLCISRYNNSYSYITGDETMSVNNTAVDMVLQDLSVQLRSIYDNEMTNAGGQSTVDKVGHLQQAFLKYNGQVQAKVAKVEEVYSFLSGCLKRRLRSKSTPVCNMFLVQKFQGIETIYYI